MEVKWELNDNKKVGNSFEAEFCELLSQHGFWAHNMAQNQTGQPADVVAAKNGVPFLIDCKVCSKDEFPLDRVEPNQESAMYLWESRVNYCCYFAMKLSDGKIYMIPFHTIVGWNGCKMSKSDIMMFPTFRAWVSVWDEHT